MADVRREAIFYGDIFSQILSFPSDSFLSPRGRGGPILNMYVDKVVIE